MLRAWCRAARALLTCFCWRALPRPLLPAARPQLQVVSDAKGAFARLLGLELGAEGPPCQRYAGVVDNGILLRLVRWPGPHGATALLCCGPLLCAAAHAVTLPARIAALLAAESGGGAGGAQGDRRQEHDEDVCRRVRVSRPEMQERPALRGERAGATVSNCFMEPRAGECARGETFCLNNHLNLQTHSAACVLGQLGGPAFDQSRSIQRFCKKIQSFQGKRCRGSGRPAAWPAGSQQRLGAQAPPERACHTSALTIVQQRHEDARSSFQCTDWPRPNIAHCHAARMQRRADQ